MEDVELVTVWGAVTERCVAVTAATVSVHRLVVLTLVVERHADTVRTGSR